MYDSEQFYPTPDNVIDLMKSHIKIKLTHHSRILDPSAGTGSLLDSFVIQRKDFTEDWPYDYAVRHNYDPINYYNLYAIEIDYAKRLILQDKKYRIIGTDFLQFYEPQDFDLVIMNPPFNKGVDHILKAWEFVKPGGQLIAIINSGTVENQFSVSRKLLYTLIEDFGYTENLGQCFQNADRTTDVDVALIVLTKPKQTQEDKFKGFGDANFKNDDTKEEINFQANPIASTNIISSLIAQYQAAEKALIGKLQLNEELKFYLSGIASDIRDINSQEASNALIETVDLSEQLQVLKCRFWNTVFIRSKMSSKMTQKFKDQFDEFKKAQSRMSFSKENILEVFMIFFETRDDSMADAITDVFDIACSFDEKNKIHTEGWKTNDAWKVNKRVIIPYGVEISAWNSVSLDSWGKAYSFLTDLEKVLSYITGKDSQNLEMSCVTALKNHLDKYNDKKTPHPYELQQELDSTFITLKIYKKGTIHIKFKDLGLLDEFNYRAGLGKLWIPDESSQARSSKKKSTKMTIAR